MGVLAIALGLGAAVATGQGTAFGETPDSSPGSTDAGAGNDESAPDPSSAPEPEPGDTESGSTNPPSAPTPAAGEEKDSPSTSTVDLGGGVVVSSSGGAHTSTPDGEAPEESGPDTAGAAKADKDPESPRIKPKRWQRATSVGGRNSSERTTAATGASGTSVVVSAPRQKAANAAPAEPSAVPVPAQLTVSAPPAEVQTVAAAAPSTQQTAPGDKGDVVKTAISAALAPLFGSGTGDVPVDSPLTWALAAAARRQFEPKPQSLTDANLLRTSEETGEDVGADAATFSALALAPGEQQNLVPAGAVGTGVQPSGVAVSGGKAYVTNATSGTMTVINLANNSVLATVPVGASPTAVVVNSAGTRAYVTNSTAGTVTVINTTNNSLVKTITVGANPSSLALTPAGDRLFVTNAGAGTVTKINTTTNTVTIGAIRVGNGPSSAAVTSDGKYVYVTNTASDSVSVITVSTSAVKNIAGVGDSPTDVVLIGGRAYVSNLDGSVAIISTATNVVSGRIQVGAPVKSLALTPDGALLIAAATNDKVVAIDTTSNAVISTLTTDPTPDTASTPGLAVAANGTIYQTDSSDNVLRILNVVTTTIPNDPPVTDDPIVGTPDQQTGEVTGTIVASDPDGNDLTYTVTTAAVHGTVTVDDDGSFAYIPRLRDRLLADDSTTDTFVITVSDGRETATSTVQVSVLPADIVAGASAPTGGTPSGLAVSGGKAYVTNASDGTMTVINLANNSVLATVPVGPSPTAVVVNTAGTRAYVTNSTAGTVTVINTTNNTLVKTITVGANPSSLALTPDGTRLFVTNAGAGTVTKINTTTNTVPSGRSPWATARRRSRSPPTASTSTSRTPPATASRSSRCPRVASKTLPAWVIRPPMWCWPRARRTCRTSMAPSPSFPRRATPSQAGCKWAHP